MSQAVYAHAFRATADWSAAEDVVSLTFLEVWRLRERLEDSDESVRPWVYGIATNVLRNRWRTALRHQETFKKLRPPPDIPDFSDDVVERLDGTDRLKAARRALGKLRRSDREVFMLCVWSDLSYSAAADALGIPVGTVRSRLSRARARLQKLTKQEFENAREKREPRDGSVQIQGDRTSAVRSMEGRAR